MREQASAVKEESTCEHIPPDRDVSRDLRCKKGKRSHRRNGRSFVRHKEAELSDRFPRDETTHAHTPSTAMTLRKKSQSNGHGQRAAFHARTQLGDHAWTLSFGRTPAMRKPPSPAAKRGYAIRRLSRLSELPAVAHGTIQDKPSPQLLDTSPPFHTLMLLHPAYGRKRVREEERLSTAFSLPVRRHFYMPAALSGPVL